MVMYEPTEQCNTEELITFSTEGYQCEITSVLFPFDVKSFVDAVVGCRSTCKTD